MALGMRTAWVLLVLKTVDWVMSFVYTYGVYLASICNNRNSGCCCLGCNLLWPNHHCFRRGPLNAFFTEPHGGTEAWL